MSENLFHPTCHKYLCAIKSKIHYSCLIIINLYKDEIIIFTTFYVNYFHKLIASEVLI